MWALGVNIPELEVSLNNYIEEITAYLKKNYLLISTYILGTTKGNTTDDLQDSRKINHQLRRTCLSANLHDTNYRKIQYTQNETLRIATGCHKMSSINHLHTEADILKVREHSELLSAQYLARCMEPGNVSLHHKKG